MYERIVTYVSGQYWALEEVRFRALCAVLAMRAAGDRLSEEEIRERITLAGGRAEGPLCRLWDIESGGYLRDGNDGEYFALGSAAITGRQTVAVIGVYGLLAHRAGSLAEMSGGTSTERLAAAVDQAAADASVKGIVLDVNSPGGAVEGVTEVASRIRAARAVKPVEAVANALAASGGYWIGSAAQYFTGIPSSRVGSVGVLTEHLDDTKAQEIAGERRTILVDDGAPFKAETDGPLTEDARASIQKMLNQYGDMFRGDVAKNRGVSVDTVRRNFGKGRMMLAKDAVNAGMIDGVGSLQDAVKRVGRGATPDRSAPPAEDQGARLAAAERMRLL
jgi:signal peptide peptidase SppA